MYMIVEFQGGFGNIILVFKPGESKKKPTTNSATNWCRVSSINSLDVLEIDAPHHGSRMQVGGMSHISMGFKVILPPIETGISHLTSVIEMIGTYVLQRCHRGKCKESYR